MTATVINATTFGTGAKVSQAIYDNNTGGNVRLIIYFIKFHSQSGGFTKCFVGPTAPNDDSLPYQTYPNTIEFDPGNSMVAGHNMGIYEASQNTLHNAGSSSGYMPVELVLADGYKFWVFSNSPYTSSDVVCQYNLLAIPE
tara:strand:+ start:458 stop:880 length:423 start_codon:yes stop_codon:yes gene_type:complete